MSLLKKSSVFKIIQHLINAMHLSLKTLTVIIFLLQVTTAEPHIHICCFGCKQSLTVHTFSVNWRKQPRERVFISG